MYVVFLEDFDAELNSVWGPFHTREQAETWIALQPDANDGWHVEIVQSPIADDLQAIRG